jgi:hypothetical protein
MTNQTYIITTSETYADPVVAITTAVNNFVVSGLASGYINFDIKPVVVSDDYNGTGPAPLNTKLYTVQINYYDPAIM